MAKSELQSTGNLESTRCYDGEHVDEPYLRLRERKMLSLSYEREAAANYYEMRWVGLSYPLAIDEK